jgi:hypothetical protein
MRHEQVLVLVLAHRGLLKTALVEPKAKGPRQVLAQVLAAALWSFVRFLLA